MCFVLNFWSFGFWILSAVVEEWMDVADFQDVIGDAEEVPLRN
jgi:hypothetical protein